MSDEKVDTGTPITDCKLIGHDWNWLDRPSFRCLNCEDEAHGESLDRMQVQDGDILVITYDPRLPSSTAQDILEAVTESLSTLGKRKVGVLALPEGVTIDRLSSQAKEALAKHLGAAAVLTPTPGSLQN